MNLSGLDIFTTAYIEAALWSSTDNADETGGEPLDLNYSISDIAPETLAEMVADCADFQASFGEYIARDLLRAGHDFWLTRNGHGAGFWDGDWNEPFVEPNGIVPARHFNSTLEQRYHKQSMPQQYATVGDYLTAMSKPYGSFDLYVSDDGKIHSQ